MWGNDFYISFMMETTTAHISTKKKKKQTPKLAHAGFLPLMEWVEFPAT